MIKQKRDEEDRKKFGDYFTKIDGQKSSRDCELKRNEHYLKNVKPLIDQFNEGNFSDWEMKTTHTPKSFEAKVGGLLLFQDTIEIVKYTFVYKPNPIITVRMAEHKVYSRHGYMGHSNGYKFKFGYNANIYYKIQERYYSKFKSIDKKVKETVSEEQAKVVAKIRKKNLNEQVVSDLKTKYPEANVEYKNEYEFNSYDRKRPGYYRDYVYVTFPNGFKIKMSYFRNRTNDSIVYSIESTSFINRSRNYEEVINCFSNVDFPKDK